MYLEKIVHRISKGIYKGSVDCCNDLLYICMYYVDYVLSDQLLSNNVYNLIMCNMTCRSDAYILSIVIALLV